MAKRISLASIARVSAGAITIIWALLGLGNALAAVTGHGLDALIGIGAAVNIALIVSAILAFTNARAWRAVMIASMLAVTADRIVNILGADDYLLALSSVVMLIAVAGITMVARPK